MMRWNNDSPNPYIPLLMLTAHTEASRVAAARDAGVSGFIRKPVSARTLFERISTVLTDPRMFVRTEDFMGPDRRRGEAANYQGPHRRASDRGQKTAQAQGQAQIILDTIDIDDERWRA
jgi:DNA-binding response OmpR family regulator